VGVYGSHAALNSASVVTMDKHGHWTMNTSILLCPTTYVSRAEPQGMDDLEGDTHARKPDHVQGMFNAHTLRAQGLPPEHGYALGSSGGAVQPRGFPGSLPRLSSRESLGRSSISSTLRSVTLVFASSSWAIARLMKSETDFTPHSG